VEKWSEGSACSVVNKRNEKRRKSDHEKEMHWSNKLKFKNTFERKGKSFKMKFEKKPEETTDQN
jgi:hypothetical protein